MQRATTADSAPVTGNARIRSPDGSADVDCPVCGEPVRGIAAARPGEHRFVGCDHYASARFLRDRAGQADAVARRPTLGP